MGTGCLIVQISSLLISLDEKQLFSEMLKKLLLLHSSEIDLSPFLIYNLETLHQCDCHISKQIRIDSEKKGKIIQRP